MRSLSDNSITEKNKQENQPILLYTIFSYDGVNNLYLAEYDSNVTFNGQVYTAFPITHDFISENSGGEIDKIKITVSNINRVFQSYLETYDLRGVKIKLSLVWANRLSSASDVIEDIYYIDSYTANDKTVEFSLSTKFDVLDVQLPFGKYFRNTCRWEFKGSECQYSGVESECNRTFQKCKELNNQIRFGGFPSIPTRKLYIG